MRLPQGEAATEAIFEVLLLDNNSCACLTG